MKRFVIPILISISLSVSAMSTAGASVTPGAKCLKVGAKQTFKGKIYTCVKSGKGQAWNKGAMPSKTVPSVKPTPKATISPTPSQEDSSSKDFDGNLRITEDLGSKNLTRFSIDAERRIMVGCNGSDGKDFPISGELFLVISTHNELTDPNLFLHASNRPKEWIDPAQDFRYYWISVITLSQINQSGMCGYISSPIPNVVKDIASDIQSLGLFFEPKTSLGRLVHLGSLAVNNKPRAAVIKTSYSGVRAWCVMYSDDLLENLSSPVIIDNRGNEYGDRLTSQKRGMMFWSLSTELGWTSSSAIKKFPRDRGFGIRVDFTDAEIYALQGTTVNCKFTVNNIFGEPTVFFEPLYIPSELILTPKSPKVFSTISSGRSLPDETLGAGIRCYLEESKGFNLMQSYISLWGGEGQLVKRISLNDQSAQVYQSDAKLLSFSLYDNEFIREQGKSYHCLFDLTGLDNSYFIKKVFQTIPTLIKTPLPRPVTLIKSTTTRGGLPYLGCFLTNWQDYSHGRMEKITYYQLGIGWIETERRNSTSKISLLRDDGSLVFTWGLQSWTQSNDDVGISVNEYDFAKHNIAPGSRYQCRYELVGLNGEQVVHSEYFSTPFFRP